MVAVTVAVGQFSPAEDTTQNIATIDAFAGRAASDGASLLVLPEYSSFTATDLARTVANAERTDGAFATTMLQIARRHRLAMVVGMAESIPGQDTAHNTLLLIGPDGRLVSTYRKVHLYDALGFRESEWIAPGDPSDAALLELEGIRIGAQTCYDLRFPEASRVLVDAGADVIAVAAQWVPGPLKQDQWTTLLHARAIENAVYVAAAGQSAPTGSGCSMIVDPMGVVVAELGGSVGVCSGDVALERVDEVRRGNPVLAARRFHVVAGRPAPVPERHGRA